ncbi:TetR/AcrR family transcriptional regulator [Microbacterium sp. TNHR37B]|uniref:TetR/AcrR family transcriptional regulator n=1 Tax=Microbacterium sp. TNHR37B TaxID=1775956 RepID=UPI0007B2FA91|nr:TetR/AcrR family transcriptional regulator [Microbacterium sp. TNHR37B]KZE91483.1 hypothetical protein AVP41_01025 [Microbacterium sp. TNHR37B]
MPPGDSEARRSYDARARRARARDDRARTRSRIIEVARDAFLTDGYGATSLSAVAAGAGVSVQTIYLAVGSKGELLRQVVRDTVLAGEAVAAVSEASWVTELAVQTDPAVQIEILVRESVSLAARAYPIWRVVAEAATLDAALLPDLKELEDGRHRDQRALVGLLHGVAVPLDRAADIVHGILSPELWRLWGIERGWPREEVQAFAVDVLVHALHRPGLR